MMKVVVWYLGRYFLAINKSYTESGNMPCIQDVLDECIEVVAGKPVSNSLSLSLERLLLRVRKRGIQYAHQQ